ncbi:MAG TPA: GNAT family N-acetyltransferase [Roseiflexaceae bacterium]|nr:GNAT family N-acetyltransferase [Roseiflexaceae bacterium]
MRFFRRTFDLSLATPREATPADLTAVSRLFSQSSHRFVGFASTNLPSLLAGAPALLLTAGTEVWAAAVAGWPIESTTWMRGLALADGLPTGAAFDMLLPPFHALLRSEALRCIYYAGDEAADIWAQPALRARGYVHETDVVVYEKTRLDVPAEGNEWVRIRRAQAVDLPALLEVDRACFDPQWNKDESIIGPSILDAPYFMVAEMGGQIVGYAFATSHFAGRLMHLVRIAVLPEYRGQSIGVRLLADVIAFARLRGADLVTLNTQAHNNAAQRLYEWFGFRRTGERQAILRFDL